MIDGDEERFFAVAMGIVALEGGLPLRGKETPRTLRTAGKPHADEAPPYIGDGVSHVRGRIVR